MEQQLKRGIIPVLLCVLLCGTGLLDTANAANRIRVATIGERAPTLDKSAGYQKMVQQMIAFWKQQLDQVIHDKPDLIVVPENADFPWGLTRAEKDEYIKVRRNQVLDFFASVAKSTGSYLVYSMNRYDEKGLLRNTGVLLGRNGETVGMYDKNYPTIKEMEAGIRPGTRVPIFDCDFGKLAIAICYDLNFDELREQYAALDPDVIVFPSAYHGGFVQSVWAYTCRAFFVGAISGRGAHSQVRNPLGEVVASSTNYFNYAVADINLDYRIVHLDYHRGKLKDLKKKYGSTVQIKDPGELGVLLVTSENESIGIAEMLKEFGIETVDDYFKRSQLVKKQNEL
ncbi:carbon-nitrogen hydrolase family protein [Parapedobacter sp. SGR-10]|uniref:carbon-nitrogen hydrolase family protein n=1 Tax=Parapedobacter sp. SGR-10 TaxID=2710879 RepID=UPI0013D84AA7|nr:nitrilase-related carbon-nitrogen hydrolase [Parapedobacter sp. SGR-10]NGF58009.1 carbon-nitrogen hydrolase family protein [Parapedobacter sp. SGR-10]